MGSNRRGSSSSLPSGSVQCYQCAKFLTAFRALVRLSRKAEQSCELISVYMSFICHIALVLSYRPGAEIVQGSHKRTWGGPVSSSLRVVHFCYTNRRWRMHEDAMTCKCLSAHAALHARTDACCPCAYVHAWKAHLHGCTRPVHCSPAGRQADNQGTAFILSQRHGC
eukprot:363760-Chlamydomonas_euryale.AAC.6